MSKTSAARTWQVRWNSRGASGPYLDTATVCRLADDPPLPYSTLDNWIGRGLVPPPGRREATGRHRVVRMFTIEDAVRIRLVRTLRKAGCPLGRIEAAQRFIARNWNSSLTSEALLWNGERLIAVENWDAVLKTWRNATDVSSFPGQQMLPGIGLIPFRAWAEETHERATEFTKYHQRVVNWERDGMRGRRPERKLA